MIDLRSDTFTQPTQEMRQAMSSAECGDDVWGEDPTVNRLQEIAADLLGKEAALFTTSGTMSNLLAILTFCNRGDSVIGGSESHIFRNEGPGVSSIAGVALKPVPNDHFGGLDPAVLSSIFQSASTSDTTLSLLALENTHNRCGGRVLTLNQQSSLVQLARTHHAQIHLDGARLFNAATYLGIPPRSLAEEVDSISFCISKGLCAPVGSLLCGSQDFINEARTWRQMLGGGMRQSGVIAAAGIIALETMVHRLTEDHETAAQLSTGLVGIPGISINPDQTQTNIVIFRWLGHSTEEFINELNRQGIKVSIFDNVGIRMVTHHGINRQDIDVTLQAVNTVAKKLLD